MDGPGYDLFSRTSLTKDQYGHIGGSDEFDLFHDAAQAGLGADDTIADVVPAEPRQKRTIVRLDRFAGSLLPSSRGDAGNNSPPVG